MLVTGGGRITCLRCTARSKKTGQQCGKPALKTSRTQKCGIHGGLSKGPATTAGKSKSAAANLRTGAYTKAEIAKANRNRALIRVLEDSANLLGIVPADTPRTRGRKPKLFVPIHTQSDVLEAIIFLRDET
jgi:hypothetical protein